LALSAVEQRKLEAEIKLIEVQIETERERLRQEQSPPPRRIDWKVWVPIILSALTVLVSAWTVGKELYELLSQRVRQYEVRLSQDMIQIAQRLADASASPLQRSTDAALLSAYEEDALPLLFTYLRAAAAEGQEPILHSLELIQRKGTVKPGTVTQALLAEARQVFAQYAADVQGTANYVIAIGRLASDDQKGALGLLVELRQRVRHDGGVPTGILAPMIEQACRQLTGKDCP